MIALSQPLEDVLIFATFIVVAVRWCTYPSKRRAMRDAEQLARHREARQALARISHPARGDR